MNAPEAISQRLAAFVADTADADIPMAIIEQAKLSLLNMLATTIAGTDDPAINGCLAVLGQFSGPADTALLGRRDRVDSPTAAFLNAAAANVFDYDDTHIPTIIHPTAPVASALLALAERRPMTGRNLLAALSIGIDIACRIGLAVSPHHYRRGWHITATCGVLGAAAASGRVLGLSPERLVWAFAIAAGQSSGLVEMLGTHAKSVAVGNAARNGLLASLLAQAGISGPAAPLEGTHGLLHVHSDAPNWPILMDDLGQRWELANNTFKPYPCGVVLNAVIDACLLLREEEHFDPATIANIDISGPGLLLERTDRPTITSGRQSQVSAQHAAAVTLWRGRPGLSEFSDAAVNANDVVALRRQVHMQVDASLPPAAATVELSFKDGRTASRTITAPLGSLDRPLGRPELEQKFRALAVPVLGEERCDQLVEAVWWLDAAPDAAVISRLAVPAPSAP